MRKQSPNYQNYHRCHLRFSFRHQEFTLKHISLKKIFGVHSCLSLTVLFDLIVIPMEIDEIYLCLKSWCGALSLMQKKVTPITFLFERVARTSSHGVYFAACSRLNLFFNIRPNFKQKGSKWRWLLYLSFRSDWPLLHLQWCLLGQSA